MPVVIIMLFIDWNLLHCVCVLQSLSSIHGNGR